MMTHGVMLGTLLRSTFLCLKHVKPSQTLRQPQEKSTIGVFLLFESTLAEQHIFSSIKILETKIVDNNHLKIKRMS